MGIRVVAKGPFTALFVPRGSTSGPPIELEGVAAQLVRASDFAVVAELGSGLTLETSGAPHWEYVIAGRAPDDVMPGALYYLRFSGDYGRKTYRAVQTLVVEVDLAARVENLTALVAVGGGFG